MPVRWQTRRRRRSRCSAAAQSAHAVRAPQTRAQAPHLARQVAQLRVAREQGALGGSELVVCRATVRLFLRPVAQGDEAMRLKPHVRGAIHPHASAKVTARRQQVALGHDADGAQPMRVVLQRNLERLRVMEVFGRGHGAQQDHALVRRPLGRQLRRRLLDVALDRAQGGDAGQVAHGHRDAGRPHDPHINRRLGDRAGGVGHDVHKPQDLVAHLSMVGWRNEHDRAHVASERGVGCDVHKPACARRSACESRHIALHAGGLFSSGSHGCATAALHSRLTIVGQRVHMPSARGNVIPLSDSRSDDFPAFCAPITTMPGTS
eukprot:194944-Prymnesium_polylepis.1